MRGPLVAKLGAAGFVAAVLITAIAWFIVGDLFSRLDSSLEVTAESLSTVSETLDVAGESLETLGSAFDNVIRASGHASASSATVSEALAQTVAVIGNDVPVSIESIRTAMPGLIDAARVIDSTLSSLALIGVPYDPEVPLDEAFADLDRQLEPLPETLRANARVIAGLIPEAQGFRQQTEELTAQMEEIRRSVDSAGRLIDEYRTQAESADSLVSDTNAELDRSAILARLLVVGAGLLAVAAMGGLFVAGKAITSLESTKLDQL
jgi:methyl-accepting chemotaxis protein